MVLSGLLPPLRFRDLQRVMEVDGPKPKRLNEQIRIRTICTITTYYKLLQIPLAFHDPVCAALANLTLVFMLHYEGMCSSNGIVYGRAAGCDSVAAAAAAAAAARLS
jgi:hypothetical protein